MPSRIQPVPGPSGTRQVLRAGVLAVSSVATISALAGAPRGEGAPVQRPPSDSVRAGMVIPSAGAVRGRIDSTGYALRAAQMAAVWTRAEAPPGPDSLGPMPPPGVAAIICPHDDFSFAGRVYRKVIPLVTAKTVVLIGVFHRYRRFGEHDRLVFDPYRTWTAPDGPVPVSRLRDALLARLPRADWTRDSTAHDLEHSLEPLVCWLRHQRPDLEIVPIIVPASHFDRLSQLGEHLGAALARELEARKWKLGRDLAIAISADAIHYGPDFRQVVFGDGGPDAYEHAVARDHELLSGPLSGPLTLDKIRTLYGTFVDPEHPDDYRWTWCGRFSVPLGLLTLERLTRASGGAIGCPVAYGTSIGAPRLDLSDLGMGPTAPSNLFHFVGYPGVAFTTAPR